METILLALTLALGISSSPARTGDHEPAGIIKVTFETGAKDALKRKPQLRDHAVEGPVSRQAWEVRADGRKARRLEGDSSGQVVMVIE